jgi:Uri superfamily endonuclease
LHDREKALNIIAKEVPRDKGGYILLLKLKKNTKVMLGKREVYLKEGYYAYIGSAMGYGGLNARIRRHIRKEKKLRWHIDRLTALDYVDFIAVFYTKELLENNFEHKVSECLLRKGANYIKGFGSSDDRKSVSHLFYSENLNELLSHIISCLNYILHDEHHYRIIILT